MLYSRRRRGNCRFRTRALQQPVLDAWRGKHENIDKAQRVFHQRARLNGAAREGRYTPDMEQAV